jgi:hypothetical protein
LVKITAWHTSFGKIKKFKPSPSWFTANPLFAKAYHENSQDKGESVHTYEVSITGNILSQADAKRLAHSLGLDFEELTTSLTENPTAAERSELVKEFEDKCDGFFHWDYDPRDWGDGESVLVFNPAKHVRIIKEMNFNSMKEAKVTGRSGPYFKGLSTQQKDKKEKQMKSQAKMSDSDPAAYKPMAGDLDKKGEFKGSKVKSAATKKVNKLLSESTVLSFSDWEAVNEMSASAEKSLKKKAEKFKMPLGVLKQVFNRGMAAWKTGHRPGQSQEAWAHARVNSFVTKSPGTWGKADNDLAKRVRK